MSSVNFELQFIHLTFNNWPVALVSDCYAVDKSAGDSLATNYKLFFPTTCAAHVDSGSIKLSLPKTMCVKEVVTFASGIRPYFLTFLIKWEVHISMLVRGIGRVWAQKNHTRKIDNIHKDFELYQVFMDNFLCQNVLIFP